MKSLIVIIIYVVLIGLEVTTLIKNKKRAETALVILLYSIGFTLSFMLVKGIKVPNPNKGIESLVKMLSLP